MGNTMEGIMVSTSQRQGSRASGSNALPYFPQWLLAMLAWVAVSAGLICLPLNAAYASCKAGDTTCQCATDIEPNLLIEAQSGNAGTAGFDIINAVFQTINDIMGSMEQEFYNGIIGQASYTNAINALVILYVCVYGILILFSLAPARAGEVVARLAKIGILYYLVGAGGWVNFRDQVSNPLLNMMNGLITQFSAAGMGGAGITDAIQTDAGGAGRLSSAAMNALLGPMTLIFSSTFAVVLIALLSTPIGWFMALAIIWGVVEFLFMLIGAVLTYIKGIVGLAFLLALAPIFLAFILFAKTKQIFFGWVNQVIGFFLTPVLLFAFLGFYSNLLLAILQAVMFPTAAQNPTVGNVNYCWVTFFKLAILDFRWWRPVDDYTDAAGKKPNSCENLCANGGDWVGPPPVGIVEVLYFLLLTHLGKNLSHFIEQIAKDISGGQSPGVVRGDTVGRWFSNNFAGGKGIGGIAKDFAGGAAAVGKGVGRGAISLGKGIGKGGAKAGGAALAGARFGTRVALHPVSAVKAGGRAVGKAGSAVAGAAQTAGTKAKNAGSAVLHAPGRAAGAVASGATKAATATRNAASTAYHAPGKALNKAKDDVKAAVKATQDKTKLAKAKYAKTRKDVADAAKEARKAMREAKALGVKGVASLAAQGAKEVGKDAWQGTKTMGREAWQDTKSAAHDVASAARDAAMDKVHAAVGGVQDAATRAGASVKDVYTNKDKLGGFDDSFR